jgi:hypothetical protein
MKKLLSFLLLCALILPFIGILGLRMEIKEIKRIVKKEILSKLSQEETQDLWIKISEFETNSKIIYHKIDNELEIEGEMYDIISVVKDGEFLKYTCYHDHKESSLKKKIKQSLTDLFAQNPLKSDKTKSLLVFLKNLICQYPSSFLHNRWSTKGITLSYHVIHLTGKNFPALKPPPPEF